MKILVINTYGGSLLLGTSATQHEIIGSYEDAGFGMEIQKANFPNLEFIEKIKDWPKQDLSEVLVIAHPPCSAFSVQNSSWYERGPHSKAFNCTRKVLEYSMENKAIAIAIESVVGACAGAWDVHQEYADKYGYYLYRILQNGCMFVPQWRQRFWAVYIRKGVAPTSMVWTLTPNWQKIKDVTEHYECGPSAGNTDLLLEKLKEKMRPICDKETWDYFFNTNHGEGILKLFPKKFSRELIPSILGTYASGMLVYLDPEGLAGVLMGGTWWYMNGRNLSESAYKRIMGFPANYIFPDRYRKGMRTYLSKSVIPQVATWIINNIHEHLLKVIINSPYIIEIMPSEIADFRISRKAWGRSFPPLRHWDDRPAVSFPDNSLVEDILGRIYAK
jgi:site-specific DNA-cytosine methylase